MYESFYGLSASPFQLTPDPDFFYSSKGHKRASAYLQYGLHKGEGFIVIAGEVGAGKTTLVRGMLEKLDHRAVVAAHIVSTQLDPLQLLREVGAQFGLETENLDKASVLAKIREFLSELHASGRRALLVIDEAQNLTVAGIEEIRMLSNFNIGSKAPIQGFLIGQPELHRTMRLPELIQFRQRTVASYHLGPLDRTDCDAYILHRLRHVGWNGKPQFNDLALAEIYQYTNGIPRRINALCEKVMMAAFLAESHQVTLETVQSVIAENQQEPLTEHEMNVANDSSSSTYSASLAALGSSAGATAANTSALITAVRAAGLQNGNDAEISSLRDIDMRISALEASNVLVVQTLRRLLTEIQKFSEESGAGR